MEPTIKKQRRRGPYRSETGDKTTVYEATEVAHTFETVLNECEIAESVTHVVTSVESDNSTTLINRSTSGSKPQAMDTVIVSDEVVRDSAAVVDFSPVVNDPLDIEFDSIMETLNKEVRVRNEHLLIVDDDDNYDTEEVAEEVTEVKESETATTTGLETNENSDVNEDRGHKELFYGSPYTVGVIVLLICTYIIRFRLPDEAAVYFLRILVCILPQGHRLMGTMYHFRKFIKQYVSDILPTIFYYCNFCYTEVNRQSKECPSCSKSLTQSGSVAYFVQMKIISQLLLLWKNVAFENAVRSHRFKHYMDKRERTISDIYDGEIYKRLYSGDGILSNKNNLSFALNTDGVPLFKSSNIGFWPVYLLINELPIPLRKQRDFSIFYGAWISSRKPQMWSFLKPLYEELKHLESEGHECTDSNGDRFICKCVLLTCTCDLPARALVYNFIQFNGGYSCWFCLDKGESCKLDTGGTCHVFRYNCDRPKNEPRTEGTVSSDIRDVCNKISNNEKQFVVRGHKGPFWFFYLKYFDSLGSCVIDYMHGVCLGVMKTLLTLWFDKSKKHEIFSVFEAKDKINALLMKITPTIFVTRVPRSLDDLSHWKSSEFRNFLLYWGVPVLRKSLHRDYFAHFCLLVRSIYLLSKENISESDLQIAEGALFLFVECFEKLYGLRYCTLNLHQLVHLVDCVKQTGPLFVNNCYIFEDLNGFIVRHIHGTQGIETQLVNLIEMLKVMPLMYDRFLNGSQNQEAIQVYLELNDSVHARHTYQDDVEYGVCPVGSVIWKNLTDEEFQIASGYGVSKAKVKQYFKVNMYKRGFYVYGADYNRLMKRQQHIATYYSKNCMEFCAVQYFIQAENCADNRDTVNLALIEPFHKEESLGCIWRVTKTGHRQFIPIGSITNINNIVYVDGNIYICPTPNRYDRD